MTILWAGLIILVSHAAEAVTGFGCTVLALPFVTALLGFNEGVMLLAVLAWLIALYFVIVKWRQIYWKQYLIIAGLAGLGLPFGIFLAHEMAADTHTLKRLLAIFIIIVALVQIVVAMRAASKTVRSWPLPAYGIFLVLGGFVHGMFASGGPLVVLYASRAITDKGRFRATLCLLWATLNTVLMIRFAMEDRFQPEFLTRLGWMLPFLAGGIVIGELIHRRVDPLMFRKTVSGVLLAVGVAMLIA